MDDNINYILPVKMLQERVIASACIFVTIAWQACSMLAGYIVFC